MTDSLEKTAVLPASPDEIFDAWIDGAQHAAMTGADATSDPVVGGEFTAWEGYIEGHHQLLDRPHRIVQSWRSSEFPDGAPDSRLELELEPDGDGTRLRLVHTEIPAGQGVRYQSGWEEFYFAPMEAYFAARRRGESGP